MMEITAEDRITVTITVTDVAGAGSHPLKTPPMIPEEYRTPNQLPQPVQP